MCTEKLPNNLGSCRAIGGAVQHRSCGKERHSVVTLSPAGGCEASPAGPMGVSVKLPPVAQHEPQPFLRIRAHARGLKSGSERNPTCLTGEARGKPLRA